MVGRKVAARIFGVGFYVDFWIRTPELPGMARGALFKQNQKSILSVTKRTHLHKRNQFLLRGPLPIEANSVPIQKLSVEKVVKYVNDGKYYGVQSW